MAINGFLNLYQADNRNGDELIDPLRFCLHEWSKLCLPLEDGQSEYVELAKKVVVCVLLILPTLISFIVGAAGIVIKACSVVPPLAQGQIHMNPAAAGVLAAALPLPPGQLLLVPGFGLLHASLVQGLDLEEVFGPPLNDRPNDDLVPRVRPNLFEKSNVGADVEIMVADFLNARELFGMMRVCKSFKAAANASLPWNKVWDRALGNHLIWGPTRIWKRIKGEGFVPLNACEYAHPLVQIHTHREAQLSGPRALKTGFFDWLMRYHKGGPVAFLNLPQFLIRSFDEIRPVDMESSVMLGNFGGIRALLIRLIDGNVGGEPVVLSFVKYDDYGPVQQHPNAYWSGAHLLDVNNSHHKNYVLGLINGEDYCEELSKLDLSHLHPNQYDPRNDPLLKRNVRLA